METSFRPAQAASQTVIKKARVGSSPNSKLRLNCDMAVLSPTLEEYTIQSTNELPDAAHLHMSLVQQQLARTVADSIALSLANLRLRETLRQRSIRDPVTGLFNRRYLEETLEREIHRAARGQQPVGIIMLDLDHFKRFNDNFGHDGATRCCANWAFFSGRTSARKISPAATAARSSRSFCRTPRWKSPSIAPCSPIRS